MDTGVEQLTKDFYKAEPQGLAGGPWASAAKNTHATNEGKAPQPETSPLTLLPPQTQNTTNGPPP